ncbi:nuclear transport factor 2 family protein [Cochleicola gelatinilyticus]|nr:nuclear transport factor 2 family protein [Cochleicola gelatinilyticus]
MKSYIIFIYLLPIMGFTQISQTSELFIQLQKQDSMLFEVGFNQCNNKVLEEITSEDLEFYHDIGGIQNKEEFLKAIAKNICGDSENKITRKLKVGSLEVFPLKMNNEIYGALQRGEHWFYRETPSEENHKTGYAKFSSLWILKEGDWKLKRVYSFDHKAANN